MKRQHVIFASVGVAMLLISFGLGWALHRPTPQLPRANAVTDSLLSEVAALEASLFKDGEPPIVFRSAGGEGIAIVTERHAGRFYIAGEMNTNEDTDVRSAFRREFARLNGAMEKLGLLLVPDGLTVWSFGAKFNALPGGDIKWPHTLTGGGYFGAGSFDLSSSDPYLYVKAIYRYKDNPDLQVTWVFLYDTRTRKCLLDSTITLMKNTPTHRAGDNLRRLTFLKATGASDGRAE